MRKSREFCSLFWIYPQQEPYIAIDVSTLTASMRLEAEILQPSSSECNYFEMYLAELPNLAKPESSNNLK